VTTFAPLTGSALAFAVFLSGAPAASSAEHSGTAPALLVTVDQRVMQFGPAVRARLLDVINSAGLAYPPRELTLLAFKDIRHIEMYGRASAHGPWKFLKDYRVFGASGTLGPKLAAGDRQVPEGIYRVESLNPNSHYYLSLRINYPNEFDRAIARRDGRTNLGGDIMIHGGRGSEGCLAVGNESVEELFVLSALAGDNPVRVIIVPTDFRDPTSRVPGIATPWLRDLYLELRTELQQYRRPGSRGN
jgi:hypothetical protein